jgi:hypothetical protein
MNGVRANAAFTMTWPWEGHEQCGAVHLIRIDGRPRGLAKGVHEMTKARKGKKPKPLTPPDLERCQAESSNGHSFMTIGGRPEMVRCYHGASYVAIENKPGKDGQKGSMSLCDACRVAFLRFFGPSYATVMTVQEYKKTLKPPKPT